MRPHLARKWRPSLALVLGGGLAGTLLLSFLGLVALRYLGPEIGFRNAAALLGTGILLATGVLGWLLVRLLLQPIQALEHYAAKVVDHHRDQALPEAPDHVGTRELRKLAENTIGMATALHNRELSVRTFTDHASHEIKTPVSAIRAAAELLQDGPGLTEADQQLVDQVLGATRQIETQLAALRAVTKARETRHLGQCRIAELLPWATAQFPFLNVTCIAPDHALPLSEEGVKLLLTQLLSNASEHGAKQVTLTVKPGVGLIDLLVQDDGTGISTGNEPSIFDPFFTTKRAQGGTGMGLTILRSMLLAHGGEISYLPSPKGACFQVRFFG